MIDALDNAYIKNEQFIYYKEKIAEVERILNGYIAYLEKKNKLN
jgi:hypothetical protein